VVAPDEHIVHVGRIHASEASDEGLGTIMIETSERAEVLLRDGGCVLHGNRAVGIGRVTDDNDLDSFLGTLVDEATLLLENAGVGLEQILALHALPAWHSAHKADKVRTVESVLRRREKRNS
jgi:hypothetical protein